MSARLYASFGGGGPCAAGHTEVAFERVLAGIARSLWRIATYLTQDRDLQDDLVQEGAIRLWELDPTRFDLTDVGQLRYLVRCVINRMKDARDAAGVAPTARGCTNCLMSPCAPARRLMCSVSGAAAAEEEVGRSNGPGSTVITVYGQFNEK